MDNSKSKYYLIPIIALSVFLTSACENDSDKDELKPEIELIFPQSCDTVYISEIFTIESLLTDNQELGSYNIEIHENFDQHGHSTESIVCVLDDKKEPVNPYAFNKSLPITEGLKEYTTDLEITIPDGIDTGDYHINISVTDKAGWQSFRIVSIKILKR